jgi:peptide/nickel transport system substrate-binding protein
MLKAAGIAVDVVMLEQGAMIQRMLKGQFDVIFFFFSATNLDPSMNLDFWLSSGTAHLWNLGQPKPATDWEKEIDDLMHQVTAETDRAERKRLFDQVQSIFAENLPMLFFVAPRMHIGVSSRVGGLEPSIIRPQLLWNVDRMTAQPERR